MSSPISQGIIKLIRRLSEEVQAFSWTWDFRFPHCCWCRVMVSGAMACSGNWYWCFKGTTLLRDGRNCLPVGV